MMNTKGINPNTHLIKRGIDLAASCLMLVALLPLMLLIALLIRLDSAGPVLFSQPRIGLATMKFTAVFKMYKFRTMVKDAEKQSGAVWASAGDRRVTRAGRLLRKTRLDELPQLYNVLCGEMSLIGPRPERPEFYQRLEQQIPFYAERTFLVQPGITGLAQINQGYDTCIEDVRTKVGYDHRYALALGHPLQWLVMDLYIAIKTVTVMITGRGR